MGDRRLGRFAISLEVVFTGIIGINAGEKPAE
jgi:hypothetical protein